MKLSGDVSVKIAAQGKSECMLNFGFTFPDERHLFDQTVRLCAALYLKFTFILNMQFPNAVEAYKL